MKDKINAYSTNMTESAWRVTFNAHTVKIISRRNVNTATKR